MHSRRASEGGREGENKQFVLLFVTWPCSLFFLHEGVAVVAQDWNHSLGGSVYHPPITNKGSIPEAVVILFVHRFFVPFLRKRRAPFFARGRERDTGVGLRLVLLAFGPFFIVCATKWCGRLIFLSLRGSRQRKLRSGFRRGHNPFVRGGKAGREAGWVK